MTLDYDSHPADLVGSGKITNGKGRVGIKELKDAIPEHCFKPSPVRSLFWLFQDISLALLISVSAAHFLPLIENKLLRYTAWAFYGWLQGLVFTGLWVLGHECGHGAFLPSKTFNNIIGFVLHSFLMTPYFSWQSTHRRHHIYANNMKLDHNYVPPRRSEYVEFFDSHVRDVGGLIEDAPITTFLRIVLQQVVGFPWYLMNNITASPKSLVSEPSNKLLGNSHFAPWGSLFRPEEAHLILFSDLGLVAAASMLQLFSKEIGSTMVIQLYVLPYLWVNHWIVAITYLHHTHPKLPKYEPEAWTFIKGATATMDRQLGFIGRHFFHDILDYHVIHHLFSRIPFYHAEEATKAIIPLMGMQYHTEDGSFLYGLWESFTQCQWVESDNAEDPKERALWYQGGVVPPPEINMGYRSWFLSKAGKVL